MKKIVTLLIIALFSVHFSSAQVSINDYKYVIVQKQFHFQNYPNEFQLNRLVKQLFEKHGFHPIVEGQTLPEDLKSNYCLAMTSEVVTKGALRTKVVVILRDCENNTVYISPEGVTKKKNFDEAYELAIKDAFTHFGGLNYRYVPNERVTSVGKSTEDVKKAEKRIEELEAEIKELKEENEDEVVEKVTEDVAVKTETKAVVKKDEPTFFKARSTDSGFELISSKTNTVAYTILKTAMNDVYTIKGRNGVVYKKDGEWIMEYTDNDKTVSQVLDIRF